VPASDLYVSCIRVYFIQFVLGFAVTCIVDTNQVLLVTVAVLNSSYMAYMPFLKEIFALPLFEMSGYSLTWICYARWWPQGFACH
jgi:hypothetical protein